MPLLLGWTGMRGVVSLAAALAIPVTGDNGLLFPHRNLILFITFIVILLTLLLQGLTLPYFIRRGNLFAGFTGEPEDKAMDALRKGLRQHVYHFLRDKYDGGLRDHAGMQQLLQHWEEKLKAADDGWMNEQTRAVFFEMLEHQRIYLTELNKDPSVDEDLVRRQLYLIDLEEERLKNS